MWRDTVAEPDSRADGRHDHRSRRRGRSRVRWGLAVVGLTVVAVGCGSDDDAASEAVADDAAADSARGTTAMSETTDAPETTAAPETTDAPETTAAPETTVAPATTAAPETTAAREITTASDAAAQGEEAVCAPYVEISAVMSGVGDPSSVPTLLDELEASVPADIDEPLTVMITTTRQAVADGMQDMSVFETPEFDAAASSVDLWVWENCPFDARVTADAVDFAYEGIDAEYAPGLTAFRVTNAGAEAHELVLLRRNEGVTDAWEDLLSLPEQEAMSKVSFLGSAWVLEAGTSETLVADLVPGDYLAICFIPAGTTSTDTGEFVEGAGQPHFMLGMQAEFTVT